MKSYYYIPALYLWIVSALFPADALSSTTQPVDAHQCGTDIAAHQLWQEQPHLQQLHALIDNALADRLARHSDKQPLLLNGDQTYLIPVVVHIVHNNGEENISNSEVMQGLQRINEALSNLQADSFFRVNFVLCPAQQDEAGMPTAGITRTRSALTNLSLELQSTSLKNLVWWNAAQYLNIWLVREISSSAGNGVAGYATYPSAHGSRADGIVMEARFFGSTAASAAVGIHEVGHYLGLYHTFQGGCGNDNCLLDGDRVCDTPPDASTSPTTCNALVNSCTTDTDDHTANNPFRSVAEGGSGDQYDMLTNYMDYGTLSCQQLFTPGQVQRMVAALLQARSSLLSSPGCNPPCTIPVSLSFIADRHAVLSGETVNFTNTSTGFDSYIWRTNSTVFSTSKDASRLFTTPGVYIVSLEASNSDARCRRIAYDTITVTCNIETKITASKTYIRPGDNVQFGNSSTGATNFTWYVNGQQKAATKDFSETFPLSGGSTVMLVASNNFCSDTAYAFINTGACGGKQANIWYFGQRAGMDFSTEPPTVLTDGKLNTYEGSASICDGAGNLLFYTDGITVWDRLHRIMPGGKSTLGGNFSSTQSALIVPHPGDESLYYIFTTDSYENKLAKGMSYAIVNMSLNNGAGEVTDVQLRWHPDIVEKITAVTHANDREIWVVARGLGNTLYSYLVSDKGLSSKPVVSTVNTVYTAESGGVRGAMKASPMRNYLALVNPDENRVELYPFNPATGEVLEAGSLFLKNIPQAYGVEFSPNGSLLYAGAYGEPSGTYQFDLTAGSPAAIQSSALFLPSSNGYHTGALQLAPNGKIYISRSATTGLGVINAPNKQGTACNYTENDIILPFNAKFGLPAFVQTWFRPEHGTIAGEKTPCVPSEASYALTGISRTKSLRWLHNGSNTLSLAADNSTASIHFTTPGIDTLVAIYGDTCGVFADTLIIRPLPAPVLSLGPDTAVCNATPVVLDAGPGFTSYLWQDGSTEQIFTTSTPGVYHVTVSAPSGCTVSDTIVIEKSAIPPLDLGPDVSVCAGTVAVLDAGPGFLYYKWQDGSTERYFTAYEQGEYYVTTLSPCGTTLRDTVTVTLTPALAPVSGNTTVCRGGSVRIASTANAVSFLWSPVEGLDDPTSPTPMASPLETTTYTVQCVNTNGCLMENQLTITVYDAPPQLSPDTAICPGTAARLAVTTPVQSCQWTPVEGLDDPTSPTPMASPLATTTYTAQYTSAEGCISQGTITVSVLDKHPITLHIPDTAVAPGNTLHIPVQLGVASDLLPLHIPHLTFSVRYKASLFKTTGLTTGFLSATRSGNDEIASVELHDLIITETNSVVTALVGSVFLGDTSSTPLAIEHATSGECTIPLSHSGSLVPGEVCNLQVRQVRLRDMTATTLAVTPNPAGDNTTAEVVTSEEGWHVLSLYNLQGQVLWQEYFTHTGERTAYAIPVQIQNIPVGLYQMVLTTPSQAVTIPVSVLH